MLLSNIHLSFSCVICFYRLILHFVLLTSHTGIIKRLLETCLSHISPIATVLIGSSQSKLLWSFHAHPALGLLSLWTEKCSQCSGPRCADWASCCFSFSLVQLGNDWIKWNCCDKRIRLRRRSESTCMRRVDFSFCELCPANLRHWVTAASPSFIKCQA